MYNYRYFACLMLLVLTMYAGAQTYQPGDKAEALINNEWKKITIVKAVPGKAGVYEVATADGAVKNNRRLTTADLRVPKANAVSITTPVAAPPDNSGLHLGRYDLFSGIPSMYLGHLVLLQDGRYKVAFGTDENNYEIGTYTFHPASTSIEWLTGMFRNNHWAGKIVAHGTNTFRIEFAKSVYAESSN
jgi:hypothetical protein